MAQDNRLTMKEAKQRLGCGFDFLRREMKRGAFKCIRVNARVVLIDRDSFERYERAKMTAA